MNRVRDRRDGGFTLVELLIAVALTGVLTAALAAAAIIVFRNSDATMGRMAGSADAQLANAYFADDVASAGRWTSLDTLTPTRVQAVETGAAFDAGLHPCGAPGTPPAALRLAWDEFSAGGTATRVVVAYVARVDATGRQLVRMECRGPTTTPVETVVVHHLAATGPTVTCRDLAGGSTSCTSVAGPARIDLVVDVADPADPTPFSVTLSGQRRQMRSKFTRDEEGSALILAMIVMTVCGLVLASLLAFADTREKTTVKLVDEGAAAASVDGATKAAVAALQNSTFNNQTGQTCFGGSDTMVLPNFNGTGDSVAVKCAPVAGSGAQSSPVLIGPSNKPGNSILTLGTAATDGLYVRNSYWSPLQGKFQVRGSIFSNGPITSVGGQIQVLPPVGEEAYASQLYALARGNCSGTITVPTGATKTCNYAPVDPRGDDPAYALPALPAPATVPTCTTVSGVKTATFSPGYYDDVDALNDVTDGHCKVYRFQPGAYYFDFHNGDHSTAVMPAAAHEWQVSSCSAFVCGFSGTARLVAGKQTNPSDPDSDCIDPTDAGNDGVRFMFGGNSRLRVEGLDTMICGKYSTSTVPVALQGVASGAETPATATMKLSSASAAGGTPTFTSPTSAKDDDGTEATWVDTSNSSSSRTRTLTATGYSASIPARSVLDSVSLLVEHRNTLGATSDSRKVTVATTSPTSTCDVALSHPGNATNQIETFDLEANGCTDVVDALAQQIYGTGNASATLTYSATVKHKGTEAVDVMQLKPTYRAPAYRAQTLSNVPGDTSCNLGAFRPSYAGSPASATQCAGLTLESSAGTDYTIRGTTYFPKSAVNMNLDLANLGIPFGLWGRGSFGVGIVSRALYVNVAIDSEQSLAALPANSYGQLDPAVLLETYVCPNPTTCAPSGTPAMTARIMLTDAAPAAPVAGKRKVTVQGWSTHQ